MTPNISSWAHVSVSTLNSGRMCLFYHVNAIGDYFIPMRDDIKDIFLDNGNLPTMFKGCKPSLWHVNIRCGLRRLIHGLRTSRAVALTEAGNSTLKGPVESISGRHKVKRPRAKPPTTSATRLSNPSIRAFLPSQETTDPVSRTAL